jgi:hypothetical protein
MEINYELERNMWANIMNRNKATKMKEGIGTFINRRTKTGKKSYDRFFIYVPTEVARDGTFPFMEGDKVKIEIKGKTVIITKAKD